MYCDVSLELLLLLLSAVNIIISDQSSDDNEVEEVRRELRVMMAARKRPSDVIMEQLNDTYTQRYCSVRIMQRENGEGNYPDSAPLRGNPNWPLDVILYDIDFDAIKSMPL